MSTTSTLPPASSSGAATVSFSRPPICPNCGIGLSHASHHLASNAVNDDAQRRISELESQVRILTGKATAAVDRLADYEDELRRLKSTGQDGSPPPRRPTPSTLANDAALLRRASPQPTTRSLSPQPSEPRPTLAAINTSYTRLSSFLPLRAPRPQAQTTTSNLEAALSRESHLRQQAEASLTTASSELEELSAELFSQANEMVATERKARAKLEQRVVVLERRDGEKKARLERLEKWVGRVERAKGVLGEKWQEGAA